MLDVIQISYYEETADEHFEILKMFAPHAKRVEGVKGILKAHQAAATIAETNNFYVVDADAIIEETFKCLDLRLIGILGNELLKIQLIYNENVKVIAKFVVASYEQS